MNKKFTINGKTYESKEFDFNLTCDLEDMGININLIRNKPMATVRAYFALCANKDVDFAGKEIQEHILAGNNIEELMEVMNENMEKSDFFLALAKNEEKETSTSEEEEEK